jgi:hypothetical protein
VLVREQIARIGEIVRGHPEAPRGELASLVCREYGWRRPNGELRVRACRDLLQRLEDAGHVRLPPSRVGVQRRPGRGASRSIPRVSAVPRVGDVCPREVAVRPIEPAETSGWREAMDRFHYLGDGAIVGETIRYVAESRGRWVALLGWGAAALKSRHREAFVGWDDRTKYRRLHLVANNVRFLILPHVEVPHLASAVLARNLRRLSADWVARYRHPILLAETFVDLSRFRGICYRAANWVYLGETRGVGRKGAGFAEHGNKKGLFVYPLHRRAREILSAPFPSPEILRRSTMPSIPVDVNKLPLEGEGGLIEVLRRITDPRRPRGIRHPIASVLALAVMATLCGMHSYEAIAEWASDLPKEVLRKLGCWCWRAPSEPTFRRILQSVDADEVDRVVGNWLGEFTDGEPIAFDGKTLRGSGDQETKPCHLLGAITHGSGLVVAQEKVDEKSNEIPGAKRLLADLDLEGRTVTADAMHTQRDLARFLVEEKGADFVFVAKENQPTLLDDIRTLEWDSFFPSAPHIRQGPRADRDPGDPAQH